MSILWLYGRTDRAVTCQMHLSKPSLLRRHRIRKRHARRIPHVSDISPLRNFVHPSGEVHCEKLGSKGMRVLHVEFRSEWIERHAEICRFLEDGSHFQGGRLGWLARRVYREFRCMDDVAPAAIEGLVLEILADASRFQRQDLPGKCPRWLIQAKDLIHARFMEALSLSDVAAIVRIHPVSLARAFRAHYHCSVGEFIRRVRIEEACKLMLSRDLPLTEVGLATGFADQAHFSRTFKRITGLTPGQFRATRRGP